VCVCMNLMAPFLDLITNLIISCECSDSSKIFDEVENSCVDICSTGYFDGKKGICDRCEGTCEVC